MQLVEELGGHDAGTALVVEDDWQDSQLNDSLNDERNNPVYLGRAAGRYVHPQHLHLQEHLLEFTVLVWHERVNQLLQALVVDQYSSIFSVAPNEQNQQNVKHVEEINGSNNVGLK